MPEQPTLMILDVDGEGIERDLLAQRIAALPVLGFEYCSGPQ